MTAPEPKPTLLATMGISPRPSEDAASDPADPSNTPDSRETEPIPRPRRPSRSTALPDQIDDAAFREPDLAPALAAIRARHRARRAVGERLPLAPLNVDVPLSLLEELREISQEVPYPLRRMTEEALELWLAATGHPEPGNPVPDA